MLATASQSLTPGLRLSTLLPLALVSLLLAGEPTARAAAPIAPLRIAELMYQPPDSQALEFVELHNAGNATLDLSGFHFDGIEFHFTPGTTLGPDQRLILVPNDDPKAFTHRYPTAVITGFYRGKLANAGETLSVLDADGRLVTRVCYAPDGFWPAAAAGLGASIEFVGPDVAVADPANWRASPAPGGTPGAPPAPSQRAVARLNELGWLDKAAAFLECAILSSNLPSLAGWTLSDDGSQPRKWPINLLRALDDSSIVSLTPGAGLPESARAVLQQRLRKGGTVGLYDPTGQRQDCVSFGPLPEPYSLGRVGDHWLLNTPTPGSDNRAAATANAEALRPNEWSANAPPDATDWIELHHTGSSGPVSLEGILFGIDDDVVPPPPNHFVVAGGFLVLTFDPSPNPQHVQHRLPANGARLQLLRSNGTSLQSITFGPQVEGSSDGVVPDGGTRIERFLQWPTPGGSNHRDTDGDGFPDAWETAHGLDPLTAEDTTRDSDADGATDVDERRAGTDAHEPASRLQLSVRRHPSTTVPPQITLAFVPAPRRSYSVLRRPTPDAAWQKQADLMVEEATGPSDMPVATSPDSRGFFIVVTPAQRLPGEAVVTAIHPQDQATGVPHMVIPTVQLLSPWPATPATDPLWPQLIDSTGKTRPAHVAVGVDARRIQLLPDTPLPASSHFQLVVTSPPAPDTAIDSSSNIITAFTTASSLAARDRSSAYATDPGEILEIRLVTRPFPGGFTFDDINAGTRPHPDIEPRVPVQLLPEPDTPATPIRQGALRQRGQSSRESNQKSYRVEISPDSADWRGLRVLNLNKHPYDLTRLRNRLSFDLLRLLPDLPGLRSLFVRLTVDERNLGLFTLVEQPDRAWLTSRGFDPQGQLYKAVMFEFQRYPDVLRHESDPAYDPARFESRLEIFGAATHAKLLEMLDALNDPDRPTDAIIAGYFHRDNYLDWLASAVLLDNKDTSSQNFLLYSPSKASTWHFVPWDYDGAWGFYDQPDQRAVQSPPRWREGIANWWGSTLHRRFLREPNNLEDLRLRIRSIANSILTPSAISNRVLNFSRTIRPLLLESPDLNELPVLGDGPADTQIELETQRLIHLVESNRLAFEATLDRPMPVFLGTPEFSGDAVRFRWTPSFHLRGHPIAYNFHLASSPDFTPDSLLHQATGLTAPNYTLPATPPIGARFWRVIILDAQTGAWQIPFDSFIDPATGNSYHGVQSFNLNP